MWHYLQWYKVLKYRAQVQLDMACDNKHSSLLCCGIICRGKKYKTKAQLDMACSNKHFNLPHCGIIYSGKKYKTKIQLGMACDNKHCSFLLWWKVLKYRAQVQLKIHTVPYCQKILKNHKKLMKYTIQISNTGQRKVSLRCCKSLSGAYDYKTFYTRNSCQKLFTFVIYFV